MEEDKMSKQIVPLDVGYSPKKEGKSNAIILKLRKRKMEWVLYDSLINSHYFKNNVKLSGNKKK